MTLNLGVVNNNQLESVVTWYVFQYIISYRSDNSWSLRKKRSLRDRLSTLDFAECISNYVDVVTIFWRVFSSMIDPDTRDAISHPSYSLTIQRDAI